MGTSFAHGMRASAKSRSKIIVELYGCLDFGSYRGCVVRNIMFKDSVALLTRGGSFVLASAVLFLPEALLAEAHMSALRTSWR